MHIGRFFKVSGFAKGRRMPILGHLWDPCRAVSGRGAISPRGSLKGGGGGASQTPGEQSSRDVSLSKAGVRLVSQFHLG